MTQWNAVKVATAPSVMAVSVAEAKAWLRVDHADEDSVIETLVRAAMARIDGPHGIGWGMMAQTWALSLDGFIDTILLPGAPVKSVTSITYLDTDGTSQTVDSGNYRVDLSRDQPRVTPAYGLSWPVARAVNGAVTVTYVVGESSEVNVPADLKTAVLLLAANYYQNREAATESGMAALPFGVEFLIRDYRRMMVTA